MHCHALNFQSISLYISFPLEKNSIVDEMLSHASDRITIDFCKQLSYVLVPEKLIHEGAVNKFYDAQSFNLIFCKIYFCSRVLGPECPDGVFNLSLLSIQSKLK